jgi:hypothetical protein
MNKHGSVNVKKLVSDLLHVFDRQGLHHFGGDLAQESSFFLKKPLLLSGSSLSHDFNMLGIA